MGSLTPTDIWEMIFEEATSLSAFIDSAWLSTYHFDLGTYETQRALALATQLSLPLICKASYSIALKFLFTRIHLFSSLQLSRLLAHFESSLERRETAAVWTKEIVLGFNLPSQSTEIPPLLLRLFKHLPRVATVVDRTISFIQLPIAALCLASFCSLKSIIIDTQTIDTCSMHRILKLCLVLDKLAIGRIVQSDCDGALCSTSLSVLHIRVIDPSANFFTIAQTQLSNLRHVTISNGLLAEFPMAPTVTFIETYGQQLVSFDWRNPYGNIDISFLFNLSPNLKRADYTIENTPPPRPSQRLPLLTNIGFHQTAVALISTDPELEQRIAHFHRHVLALNQFPTLKLLSVLDQTSNSLFVRSSCLGRRVASWWRRWAGALAKMGISVEDRNGRVLEPRKDLIIPLWMIKGSVGCDLDQGTEYHRSRRTGRSAVIITRMTRRPKPPISFRPRRAMPLRL